MRLLLVICLAMQFSLAAFSEPAPPGCGEHFLGGEMPDVSRFRADKSRRICFSEYAVLHSGIAKTPIWAAQHLTRDGLEAAQVASRYVPNNLHAEAQLPVEQRSELSDYPSGRDYETASHVVGFMASPIDMSTRAAQRESLSLANAIPQEKCNWMELWPGIESAVAQMAVDNEEIYVVTGPIYSEDIEKSPTIGDGVRIPSKIFKAVYVPSLNAGAVYVAENKDTKDALGISFNSLSLLADIDVFPNLSDSVKRTAMILPPPRAARRKCDRGLGFVPPPDLPSP
jgi:endonuclease G, mitochondrial